MIKHLTYDNLFPPLCHSRDLVVECMTTETTFSRQNDAGSRASTSRTKKLNRLYLWYDIVTCNHDSTQQILPSIIQMITQSIL